MGRDVRDGVNRSPRAEHNGHDRLLVARFASEDAAASELDQARRLVASCPDCAALAGDIRLLSNAIGRLPAPPRQRDFRLSREQAAALRGSWFDRFLGRLAAPGTSALRPLAGVAMSIGLALAVIGTGLPLPLAQPAAAPAEGGEPMTRMSKATPAGEPTAAAGEVAPAATAGTVTGVGVPEMSPFAGATPGAAGDTTAGEDEPYDSQATEQPADPVRLALVYGGVTIAALAFAVLLLAWYARRRTEDRLVD
ncbi:MAG: hypothetical protein M3N29_07640 [Chloroflexota bacterium]|nr:hypothetical protein [Chloroflexota bacterium]